MNEKLIKEAEKKLRTALNEIIDADYEVEGLIVLIKNITGDKDTNKRAERIINNLNQVYEDISVIINFLKDINQ